MADEDDNKPISQIELEDGEIEDEEVDIEPTENINSELLRDNDVLKSEDFNEESHSNSISRERNQSFRKRHMGYDDFDSSSWKKTRVVSEDEVGTVDSGINFAESPKSEIGLSNIQEREKSIEKVTWGYDSDSEKELCPVKASVVEDNSNDNSKSPVEKAKWGCESDEEDKSTDIRSSDNIERTSSWNTNIDNSNDRNTNDRNTNEWNSNDRNSNDWNSNRRNDFNDNRDDEGSKNFRGGWNNNRGRGGRRGRNWNRGEGRRGRNYSRGGWNDESENNNYNNRDDHWNNSKKGFDGGSPNRSNWNTSSNSPRQNDNWNLSSSPKVAEQPRSREGSVQKWGGYISDEEDTTKKQSTTEESSQSTMPKSPVQKSTWGYKSDDEEDKPKESMRKEQSPLKETNEWNSGFNNNNPVQGTSGNSHFGKWDGGSDDGDSFGKWGASSNDTPVKEQSTVDTKPKEGSFGKWGATDSDDENFGNWGGDGGGGGGPRKTNKWDNNDDEQNTFNNNRNNDYNNRGGWKRNSNDDGNNNQGGRNRNNMNNNRGQNREKRLICKYFKMGSCRHGDNCKFLHESANNPSNSNNQSIEPAKKELCKFYEHQQCYKRNNCSYMHEEFPCKLYHAGSKMCPSGDSCKYSHAPLNEETKDLLGKYLNEKVDERTDKSAFENSSNNLDNVSVSKEENNEENRNAIANHHDAMYGDMAARQRFPGSQDMMRMPYRPWNPMMRFPDVPMDLIHRQRFMFERFQTYPLTAPNRIYPRGMRGMMMPAANGMPPYHIPSLMQISTGPNMQPQLSLEDNKEGPPDPYIDNLAQLVANREIKRDRSPKRLVDILDSNIQCDDVDDFGMKSEVEYQKRTTPLSSPIKTKSPEIPPGSYVPNNSMTAVQPNVRLGTGHSLNGDHQMMYGGFPAHPADASMMDFINMSAFHYPNPAEQMNFDKVWKLMSLDVPIKIPYPLMNIETQELLTKYVDPRLKGHPSVLNPSTQPQTIPKPDAVELDIGNPSLTSPPYPIEYSKLEESPIISPNESSFVFNRSASVDESSKSQDRSYLLDPRFKRKKVNPNTSIESIELE